MMTDRQQALVSLLLGSFPTFASGDAEAALASYELVMADFEECDIEGGVMILIRGEYPGHDGRFAPTAPILATAMRKARDMRLEREAAARRRIPPPEPEIEKDPRIAAGLRELAGKLADTMRTEDAKRDRSRRNLFASANARFAPDNDVDAQRRRLGFDVGDPDDDGGAA